MIQDILLRILAVFILDSLGTIGASSIFGINTAVAASVAGLLSITVVFQDLARAFLADGKLTKAEVNEIFSKASKKKEEK